MSAALNGVNEPRLCPSANTRLARMNASSVVDCENITMPTHTAVTPVSAMRRTPNESTIIPVNGASSPFSKLRIEKMIESSVLERPVSSVIGSTKTPKLKTAIPSTRKLLSAPAPAMYQP